MNPTRGHHLQVLLSLLLLSFKLEQNQCLSGDVHLHVDAHEIKTLSKTGQQGRGGLAESEYRSESHCPSCYCPHCYHHGCYGSCDRYKAKKYTNSWPDYQCDNLGTFQISTLNACKDRCWSYGKCTAVNYNSGTDFCVLRGCKKPVPYPSEYGSGYRGYKLLNKPYSG